MNDSGGKTMANDADKGVSCCAPPIRGLTKLTFLDGAQVRVNGLNEILAAMYEEGKQVNTDSAEEIVERLKRRNYIPPSARLEYESLLFKKYRKYVEGRAGDNTK
jgi:hypothetical protein